MMGDKVDPLTDEEIKDFREMRQHYRTGGAIMRLIWKTTVAIGAAVAGLAAFKDQVISLIGKGH